MRRQGAGFTLLEISVVLVIIAIVMGGVMVTLASLCRAVDVDMAEAGYCELDRNWRQLLARERQYLSPHGNSATAR